MHNKTGNLRYLEKFDGQPFDPHAAFMMAAGLGFNYQAIFHFFFIYFFKSLPGNVVHELLFGRRLEFESEDAAYFHKLMECPWSHSFPHD